MLRGKRHTNLPLEHPTMCHISRSQYGHRIVEKFVLLLFVDQTEVLYTALQNLLNQLTQHFCAVPRIMCQFLNKLQGMSSSLIFKFDSPCDLCQHFAANAI